MTDTCMDEVFHGNAIFHAGGRKATVTQEEIGLGPLGCLEGNSAASAGFDERFFARSLKRNLEICLKFVSDHWLK